MPDVTIDKDEWYPVYSIVTTGASYGNDASLTDAEVAQVTEAFQAFNEAQAILRRAYAR